MDETTRLQHRDSIHSGNFWSQRTFLEKVLLILLVVVIAVGVALSISLASYKKEHCHIHPDTDANICETPECVTSAAYLISAMDTSVEPCNDFFSFACGGYLNKTFLLGNRVGRFTKLSINIVLRMKELLEEELDEDDAEHWKKTKSFYKACMNLVDRQILRGAPLEYDLKAFGDWPLLNEEWNAATFSWSETLKMMFNNGYNKDILMTIDVDLDLKNSSKPLLKVDQPVLTMPRILYLLDPPHDYAILAYRLFILKCSILLNGNMSTNDAIEQINDAMEIEKRLARASLSLSERKNFAELYVNHIMTLEELEGNYSAIPWKDLFTSFLPENVTLTGEEKIWVPVPSAISELHDIVKEQNETTKRQLANYMMYRTVLMAAPDLSHAFLQSFYDFHDILTGTPFSYPEPWQECVDVTGFYFFYSISSMYTRRYFQQATKEDVSDVEKNIKEVLKDEIRDARWIDDTTQDEALLKAETMRAIIGYPEDILNNTILNGFFEKLSVGENHYKNVRLAYKFYSDKDMEGLHEKYDKRRWDATGNLLMANAFYSPTRNTITIPVGVLQEETYNAAKPNEVRSHHKTEILFCTDYLNYGSLGMLLGHELTHGFDMTGGQFDEKGDWKFWWTNESYAELKNRSQCFVEQYNDYAVPGTNKTHIQLGPEWQVSKHSCVITSSLKRIRVWTFPEHPALGLHSAVPIRGCISSKKEPTNVVNGTLTLNENMADTGGIHAAYKAYQLWVERYGKEKYLPGLPYTPNQLFWLSFASVWCSKETPKHLIYALMYEEHAPPRYRVKGTLSNLKEFATDFKCKKESTMNPDRKCLIWT